MTRNTENKAVPSRVDLISRLKLAISESNVEKLNASLEEIAQYNKLELKEANGKPKKLYFATMQNLTTDRLSPIHEAQTTEIANILLKAYKAENAYVKISDVKNREGQTALQAAKNNEVAAFFLKEEVAEKIKQLSNERNITAAETYEDKIYQTIMPLLQGHPNAFFGIIKKMGG